MDGKSLDPRKKGGEHHGPQRQATLARRRVMSDSLRPSGCASPLQDGQSQVALSLPCHEEAELPRKVDSRNLVNTQRRNKEARTKFPSSHVVQANDVHELIRNGKPTIQASEEPTGQTTGHH